MASYALYLLPALAIIILIEGSHVSVKGNLAYRSRKIQRQIRNRVLFFRALVISLILATVLTRVAPLESLSQIAQGVLFTIIIMAPVCLFILISNWWEKRHLRLEDEPGQLDTTPANAAALDLRAASAPSKPPTDIPATATRPPAAATTPQPSAARKNTSRKAEKFSAANLQTQQPPAPEQESALDQTLSVGEQLETLDELVDFHDIGDSRFGAPGADEPNSWLLHNPLEKAIAIAREGMLEEPGIQDYSTENLPAKSRIELSEMVVRLRNDKMKLQKLIIAQKAVIDSEKQAHERTRVVVKDAISVMRHARHGQRIAEKVARRERAQRLRVEKDYIKVRRQLDNALSTLKPEQHAQVEKEKA
ncbi:hypothetical protein [Granulosicoccus antarcticus]|uniref:Uncharacterized protein n=1 Tax=Granulosicoccus antarcticus IMCC3135 TaxID=1192854 RepID=A0A2Z2NU30_9GAMM|nr:hypothetical protein [Granulosicoccus antarcticus]ASJ75072.1 hypothetical protein IMCC3135_25045 [Granulosicoccus antarcticus IMCC3135]